MHFLGGKNPKICQKWLILAILSSNGASGRGRVSDGGGGKFPLMPLDAATGYL